MGETKGTGRRLKPLYQGLVDALTIVDEDESVVAEISQDFAHHKGRELAEEYARVLAASPSALASIRERMGLYEKDFGFTESMNLDNFNQYAKGPQWNRAYGNYESLMEMREILER